MDDPSVAPDENWDGFPSVENPTVPYVGPIPGGLKPGKTIQVKGQIAKNATKFSVNLQCGENSLPYADAAFHFNPRFEDVVIRNTRVGGEWGSEERNQACYPIPFCRGENFEMVIQCESEKFKIFVNGKHYIDYKHRLPIEGVAHISFKSDVEIKAVRYGKGRVDDFIKTSGKGTMENNTVENNHTDLPSTPFVQPIQDKLQHGSLIYVSGYILPSAKTFNISLQQGDECIPGMNCAFHINARFQSAVHCCTMVDELWGSEEITSDLFPFVRGLDFDLKIQCRSTGYKVWVDDVSLLHYNHRIEDLDRINCVSIEGNLEVISIGFTQEDPDQDDEEEEEEREWESSSMDVDEGAAGDQSIEQESVSINSVEEEQSIDSAKQSSEKEEEMEGEEAPSEEAEASPQEASAAEASPQEGSADSISEKEQTDSPQDSEQKTGAGQGDASEAPSHKDSEDGEPESKKMKLDDGEDEKEDAGEESGADSDDSEKKDGDFDVERILTRRKGPDGDEYLLKWSGWSLYDCTWEPEANVSKGVRRAFDKPIITRDRLVSSCDIFYESVQSHLTGSKSEQMKLRIEHDILRNILGESGRPADKSDPTGWRFYNKSDLQAWSLPDNWWYRLDKKGHGKQVSFPIKMKMQLDWTPLSYVMDKHRKLIPARRKPLELLLVQMKKRDYSA